MLEFKKLNQQKPNSIKFQQKIIEDPNLDEENQDETDILCEKIQEEEPNLNEENEISDLPENVQERSLNLENSDNINQQQSEEPNIDEENHNEDDLSTEIIQENPINIENSDDFDQSKSKEEQIFDEENEISDLPENIQERSLNIENVDNINQQEPNIHEEDHNENDLSTKMLQERSLNLENSNDLIQQQSTEEPNLNEENNNEDDLSTKIIQENSDTLDQQETNKEPFNCTNTNFIEENEITNSLSIVPLKSSNSISTEQNSIINDFISSNNFQGLIEYLNKNCDNETTSFVFNKFYQESPDLYLNLCKEGISLHNAVLYHKYAISLIFDSKPPKYEEAVYHLKESIKLGFNFSYFSLSRLYYEVYKDKNLAYQTAKEGEKQGEIYSKCLLGFYISHGIGTTKNLIKGAKMILSSEADHFYENFATEIGLYYSIKNEDQSEIFKWFERAFNLWKTKATINNGLKELLIYGIVPLKS